MLSVAAQPLRQVRSLGFRKFKRRSRISSLTTSTAGSGDDGGGPLGGGEGVVISQDSRFKPRQEVPFCLNLESVGDVRALRRSLRRGWQRASALPSGSCLRVPSTPCFRVCLPNGFAGVVIEPTSRESLGQKQQSGKRGEMSRV